ncbi:uncharacterized protein LOC131002459 [Salvia miltiorrhiza]|uniref:uncharacterized protein LOC131002459 n=1 Tax=Salvia miltiorrhiza TaxID=226208 RepID=UPI0025AD0232|nr:uncharacterized protein LOC131002459 [Salvia miltiorrhiza]
MPQYAKFLRDVVSRKKKLGDFETVNLNEECSAILQRKLHAKIKDSSSFTLSCIIGGQQFGRALCDLGASINLMHLSIFQRLAIGEMKPTSMVLQMVDRLVTYPHGVVEDVLVRTQLSRNLREETWPASVEQSVVDRNIACTNLLEEIIFLSS